MELGQEIDLHKSLNTFFGFDEFKGEQEKIIRSVLKGDDTFVIMPTGGGKSLCYQLPALIQNGLAIVVSPLIALMKNQVDILRSNSREDNVAHYLNSSLTKSQIKEVRQDVKDGKTKLLYIAPETLGKKDNIEFLKTLEISFLAVDEAHCISEWGHDFRPEYRKIRQVIDLFDYKIPVIALTATATPKVQYDIIKTLVLKEPKVFVSSFNRSNLYYEMRSKGADDEVLKDILKVINRHKNQSGIIYCLSRKNTEMLAESLQVNGIKAAAYHAGLDAAVRAQRQDDFLMEEMQVIVATIAFGMGIDKPDVRFVIHYNISRSLEGYYQETGRAGRDGLEGDCVSFFSPKDLLKLEKFLKDKPVSEREIGNQLLLEVSAYAETNECRRKFLLHYFGEEFETSDCACKCDNCKHPSERKDGTDDVKMALKIIDDLEERFGIDHVVFFLIGKKTQRIIEFKQDQAKLFGVGKEKGELHWNSVIRRAILEGLVNKDIETYGVLKLADKGRAFIQKTYAISFSTNRNFEMSENYGANNQTATIDSVLLNLLKSLRKNISKQIGLPPFVIFQDPSLEEMCIMYPITNDELAHIHGVSSGKARRYGKKFIELISDYVDKNEIERPDDVVLKSVVKKSSQKVYIIQNIDQKISLDEIADSRGLEFENLLNELETIVNSGTKLNVDYYIDELLDEEQQEIIYDYFYHCTSDNIILAMEELEEYDFEQTDIQLMRIKFMSELAN